MILILSEGKLTNNGKLIHFQNNWGQSKIKNNWGQSKINITLTQLVLSSSWQVLYTFLPRDDDLELADYFYCQLSRIQGKKKAVHDFLTYIESRNN